MGNNKHKITALKAKVADGKNNGGGDVDFGDDGRNLFEKVSQRGTALSSVQVIVLC